jgi:hypothetical protein
MDADYIDITHPNWRALRIDDIASVEYLSKMLRQGWFISPLGIGGVKYFVMSVPLSVPKRINFKDEHQLLEAQQIPTMTIVALNKGATRDRQRVIVARADQSIYSARPTDTPPSIDWKLIAYFRLVDKTIVYVFEQGRFAEE